MTNLYFKPEQDAILSEIQANKSIITYPTVWSAISKQTQAHAEIQGVKVCNWRDCKKTINALSKKN